MEHHHATAADVVTALSRGFLAGDPDAARRLLAPDVRIEQPPSLPHGGTYCGPDGMGTMAARFAEHWTRRIDEPRIIGCGPDTAVQVTTQTWTSRATGRSATVDVVELFRVEGGFVREIRVFPQDTGLLLRTLAAPG